MALVRRSMTLRTASDNDASLPSEEIISNDKLLSAYFCKFCEFLITRRQSVVFLLRFTINLLVGIRKYHYPSAP